MPKRSRTLVLTAGVAAGALAVGVFAGTRITSPADAAAQTAPPDASAVTVPVERRTLESTVVTRADVTYTDAVRVRLELAGLETSPVVTGQVPDVGDTVRQGDVLLEIVGRPVLLLPGGLPMYRSLRPGMNGPDVEQLEEALEKLGYDPGTVDDTYTSTTGQAVADLFEEAGYEPPPADPEAQAELDAAEETVSATEDEVADAESALRAATQGPSEAERVEAQNAVDRAERALDKAKDGGDADAIAEAEGELRLAEASQRDLLAGQSTEAEEKAVDRARDRLAQAQADRDEAAAKAGTPLPAAEVAFIPSLPRRVDELNVKRGHVVDGPVMSISGADLVVKATVDKAARDLLEEDMEAIIEVPDGGQLKAPITAIRRAGNGGDHTLVITPKELTSKQVEALRAANVKVTIPVESTEDKVLAVPLAALTSGPGGEARVEVQRGTATAGDEAPKTDLVEVEVGLTADGYAEVRPIDGELEEGDLVVVGNGETPSDDE